MAQPYKPVYKPTQGEAHRELVAVTNAVQIALKQLRRRVAAHEFASPRQAQAFVTRVHAVAAEAQLLYDEMVLNHPCSP